MRRVRPLAATAGVLALLMGAFAGPAGAQPSTDVYQGSAAGRGLRLRLLTTELSAGNSSATAASDQTATGTGSGLLVLLGTPQGSSTASVPPGDSDEDPVNAAAPAPGPPQNCVNALAVAVVNIRTACSSSVADRTGGLPAAASVGQVADVVVGAIAPVLTPIATLPAGSTVSEVVTTPTTVTAEARATGGQLDILPIVGATTTATVSLSPALASVECDRATGRATPTADAAAVSVVVPAVSPNPIVIPPSPNPQVVIPNVLSITVTGGTAQGNRAEAAGVSISILNDLVRVDLSSVQATVNCARLAVGGVEQVAELPNVLPRTGGTPWAPMATGAGVLALAVLVRRVVVRSR